MEEGPDLAAPIEGRGEKLGSARAEDLVGSRAIRLQSEQNTHETLSRFSSDPREFFRVGNDANRLDLPLLHLNGQDGECLTASADDQGCLTVNFL